MSRRTRGSGEGRGVRRVTPGAVLSLVLGIPLIAVLGTADVVLADFDLRDCDPDSAVGSVAPNWMSLALPGRTMKVPYEANLLLDDPHPGYGRAVVMVHGICRDADRYYDDVLMAAAIAAGNAQDSSILIAPQFLAQVDVDHHGLDNTVLFWTTGGWKQGNKSANTDGPRISSFAVMDTILLRLAANNTGLQHVVVAGHSAGGQFVNRYAAGTSMHEALHAHGVTLKLVVANPSSYLYFNPERRIWGTEDQFATPHPDTIAWCPGYDDYPHGLDSPNSYMNQGDDVLREQYRQKWVTYLLGTEDTAGGDLLDTSCKAMLQGRNRYERGRIYYNYLKHFFGSDISCKQLRIDVAGVDHSAEDMYTDAAGLFSLFDFGYVTSPFSDCVWVDFAYSGTEEGTFERPYNTVNEGLTQAPDGGAVMFKGGSASDTPTITKNLILRSWESDTSIGQ